MSNKGNKLKIEFHYTYLIMAISFILTGYYLNLIVFTSLIIIHEFGHYIVARIFNFNVSKIIIYPYGGITKISDFLDREINKELLIACAGIIMQFSFYLVISYLHSLYFIRAYTMDLYTLYNRQMIFFNLLPIIPLDGFRIVNLLLNKFFCYNLSNKLSIIISIIMIIIILFIDIYSVNYSNVMIMGLMIFYIIEFGRNIKYLYRRFLLEKWLYPNNYSRVKIINNKEKMYRNRKHLFYGYIVERDFLKKIFT